MYRLLILCLQIVTLQSVPLQFYMPNQMAQRSPMQSPLPLLQEQMMELQAAQRMNPVAPLLMDNPVQPMIILLPETMNLNPEAKDNSVLNKMRDKSGNHETMDGDSDSVVIDAEPSEPIPTIDGVQKGVLLLPNTRYLIGNLISSIPWLPIEINVPDSISWAYNGISSGISSIISIIGQGSQSSQPQGAEEPQESKLNFKSLFNLRNNRVTRPLILMPFSR